MLSIAPRGDKAERHAAPATAAAKSGTANAIPAFAAPDGDEKTERRPASDFPQITGLRFKPHGVEATLIDLSESGLLAECGERLKPGSAVTAVFEGTFTPSTIEGRIARCAVWSVGRDGRLRYHIGIEFARPCPLDDGASPAATTAPAVASEPVAVTATAAVTPAPATVASPAPSPAAAAAPVTPAPVAKETSTAAAPAAVSASVVTATSGASSTWTSVALDTPRRNPRPAVVRNRW